MSNDIADSFSQNPFKSAPASSSIENQFRMAQVLQRKGDIDFAIKKYIELCLGVEKTVLLNPGADVELQWPVLALGSISDIYQDKQDYNKAIAFRKVQNEFLTFMKMKKQASQSGSDSDENEGDFFEIATTGHQYQALFKKMHEAIDEPEAKPRESAEELAKRIIAAKHKEEEDKIEEIINELNKANAEREAAIQRSFFKRNLRRITEHPIIFVTVLLSLTILTVLYIHFKPKKKVTIPGGLDANIAFLQKYMADYEKKHGIKHDHDHHHHHFGDHEAEYKKGRHNRPEVDPDIQKILQQKQQKQQKQDL